MIDGRKLERLCNGINRWLLKSELQILTEAYFPKIALSVPWQEPAATVTFELCQAVERHGLFDSFPGNEYEPQPSPGFLAVLAAACPSHEAEIRDIAVSIGVSIPEGLSWIRLVPPEARRRRIFLSYSRKDDHRAQPLRMILEALGVEVFLDTETIQAGHEWASRLETALRTVHQVVVLWSSHAAESDWVRREVAQTLETIRVNQLQRYLVVVRLDDTPARELEGFQHIDARLAMPEVDPDGLLAGLAADERAAVLLVAERLRAARRVSRIQPSVEPATNQRLNPSGGSSES